MLKVVNRDRSPTARTSRGRFELLDGIRGIAALIVLVYHTDQFGREVGLIPHGYLAVDIFFVLSGFVVAAAYERRLRDGLHPIRFMLEIRAVRLYPLIALGLAWGVLTCSMGPHPPAVRLKGILEQAFFIPAIKGGGALYPYNNVQWSLVFEVLANIAHALILVRLPRRALTLIVALSGALLVACGLHWGTLDLGNGISTMLGGLARVCFSYTAGVWLYRLPQRNFPLANAAGAGVFALLFAFLLPSPAGSWSALHDVLSVGVLFPALVYLSVGAPPLNEIAGRIGSWLGSISYPVYALQLGFLFLGSNLLQAHMPTGGYAGAFVGLDLAVVLGAWAALRFFDEPVRRHASDILKLPRRTPAATAP